MQTRKNGDFCHLNDKKQQCSRKSLMLSPFCQCTIMYWISFYLEVFGWIRKLHQIF